MDPLTSKTAVTVISRISERPAPKDACLIVIYGSELGKKFNLDHATTLIGRSSKSAIQVDQEAVSRLHCKVLNTGKEILVRDMASTNGTYVNDVAIDEHTLADGDLIKIGRTIFKFLSGGNIEHTYHDEIYRLTTVDGLTQAHNRRYFLEVLEREISRSQRYGRALSLIMFDLDRFKEVNDKFGHLAGDHVLKELLSLIRPNIRKEDIVGRYGGEEFAILLPEIDGDHAVHFAEKIRALVEKTVFHFEGADIPVTISVGVVSLPQDCPDGVEFIRVADEKLYDAKRAGRNRVCR